MSEPPLKKIRINNIQKERLVEWMAEHKDVALGTFTCPMGLQAQNARWESLALELAELGPSKSVDQWKTTWRDIKCRAKSKNAETYRALHATGNKIEVPSTSRTNDTILSVIGRTTSQGLAGVPEKPTLDQLTKSRLELVELQKEIALEEHEFVNEEHKLKILHLQNDERRKQEIHEVLLSQLRNRVQINISNTNT